MLSAALVGGEDQHALQLDAAMRKSSRAVPFAVPDGRWRLASWLASYELLAVASRRLS